MPNQRIVVADLKAGRSPDPKYGKIAKLRSTHNNYLTLPVIFLMLSNHYPLAFGTRVFLDHRIADFPHGCYDPPLLQHAAFHRQGAKLDLGGDGDFDDHHRMAEHGEHMGRRL